MKNGALASSNKHRPITPHTILSAKLSDLKELMLAEQSNQNLLELVDDCKALIDPLDAYLAQHSSSPSEALNTLEIETNALDWDNAFDQSETDLHLEKEMLSGAVEGQFLKLLVAITNAKQVLEIGSFTSYASLAMAEALPPDGNLIACEYDKFTATFAQKQLHNSQYGKKVKIVIGDALKTLEDLAQNNSVFDLIFIDADKAGYENYFRTIMDFELLKKNGLICVDNTLYMGQAYGAGDVTPNGLAIQKFNRLVANDERVQQVLLPLRDGVTLIRRIA
ncbi:O-methyltransferase [Psychroserpens sp.]|uniref:O-methyltransferase n=1 Tax=Psychroserpens sp. TaxID=2020870 RepID=UPI003C7091DE